MDMTGGLNRFDRYLFVLYRYRWSDWIRNRGVDDVVLSSILEEKPAIFLAFGSAVYGLEASLLFCHVF